MGNDLGVEEITDSNHIPRDFQNRQQQITFHDACFRNNKTFQVFCENICVHYPSNAKELLQVQDELFCTPLHYGIAGGHVEIVQTLLQKHVELLGVQKTDVINRPISEGATCLHIAISSCHMDVFRLLLEYKADVNVKTSTDFTPLHAACTYGDIKTDGGSLEMVGPKPTKI
eukprot:TRINITY_DN5364_c0_g1_i14.p1 TRINITY_DN5364_c0_g1~~TRINITY_DN5364_c0_g1_i14.p1  ORF type:complete len:195 (+),score=34.90 TRINITY_DN5364_c0_g1_i14:71-586(+)